MESKRPNDSLPERYEIIGGVIYDMTPPPPSKHQFIVGNLLREFAVYLKGKTCKVVAAPFGVWLSDDTDDYVEPDLSVICDATKIHRKGCIGAPDLIVEVLSKSTAAKDEGVKLRAYRRSGVKEYWIVDPNHEIVKVYRFEGNVFSDPEVYSEGFIKVGVLENLSIHVADIFE